MVSSSGLSITARNGSGTASSAVSFSRSVRNATARDSFMKEIRCMPSSTKPPDNHRAPDGCRSTNPSKREFKREKIDGKYVYVKRLSLGGELHKDGDCFDVIDKFGSFLGGLM